MVGLFLAACAATSGNWALGFEADAASTEVSASAADRIALAPPSFPLGSPVVYGLISRDRLSACAFRVEEPRVSRTGNHSFDYPAASQPSPGAAAAMFDMPQSPATGPAMAPIGASQSVWGQAVGTNLYARVDYFYWRETYDRDLLLDETGPLVTLGFRSQMEDHRFRVELFGGQMDYDGQTTGGDPFRTDTDYLGFRAQVDFLWPFAQDPNTAFVASMGTRLWNRKILSGTSVSGLPVTGYDETWWTLYPSFGLETREPIGPNSQWFGSASVGITAFNYEHIGSLGVTLYPKMGPQVQIETGIQTPRLTVSLFFEATQWYASDSELAGVEWVYQPDSMMLTAGVSGGVRF